MLSRGETQTHTLDKITHTPRDSKLKKTQPINKPIFKLSTYTVIKPNQLKDIAAEWEDEDIVETELEEREFAKLEAAEEDIVEFTTAEGGMMVEFAANYYYY